MDIKPQKEFPLLKEYRKAFPIDDNTIFAYDWKIYSNHPLTEDLIIHEIRHFRQQDQYGLKEWVEKYLNDPEFRLKMEIEAYRVQIASITNREWRWRARLEAIKHLTSGLYGFKVNYQEANKLLKIK